MKYCKICGGILSEYHYAIHDLTEEQYNAKYSNDKTNPFRNFKIPPKREVSECEKRDAIRNFNKQAR